MNTRSKRKKIAENDKSSAWAIRSQYGDEAIIIHQNESLDQRAVLAANFTEKWALVAGEADGEDTAGRQKIRRLSPVELASHACETVEALYAEFAKRGWTLALPDYDKALAQLDDKPNATPEN